MQDVKKDRDKYCGGSDMPIIMGLSPFNTRWHLLLEKAGYEVNDFEGNEYTRYGEYMEPIIREYVSEYALIDFKEDKRIDGRRRYHADGYGDGVVLEIKTTSQIHDKAEDYKAYMVQLMMGIDMFDAEYGLLAVYERPDDFDRSFDPLNLRVFKVERDEELIRKTKQATDLFLSDLDYLKEYPLATEADLPSKYPIVPVFNELLAVEEEMQKYILFKTLEKKETELKAKLKTLMEEYGIDSYDADNGARIKLVADGKDKEVDVFNEEKFKAENPDLWKSYTERKVKKGRAGHVRFTPPHGDKE